VAKDDALWDGRNAVVAPTQKALSRVVGRHTGSIAPARHTLHNQPSLHHVGGLIKFCDSK
jgi:hypothetical protein